METATFTPPYLPFATVLSFLERLAEKAIPPRIDRSMMDSMSGANQTYLMSALRSIAFIGENHEVLPPLVEFVGADEGGRQDLLADLIRRHYPEQLALAGRAGTEQQLLESFTESFGVKGDTRRKAVVFFLNAARYAGLELSPHFPNTRNGSGSPPAGTKRRRPKKPPVPPQDRNGQNPTGDVLTVDLDSGGSIWLGVSVNLFGLSSEDRVFVLDLIDRVRGYQKVAQQDSNEE